MYCAPVDEVVELHDQEKEKAQHRTLPPVPATTPPPPDVPFPTSALLPALRTC